MVRRILWPLCGVMLLLLGGCSSTVKRLSAKEYYNQANEFFVTEDFSYAADQYQELLDQYPLNPYAEEAQLKIAYAHYLDKKYTEALAAFSDFERAYPTSSHLPFVQYYRGMSYLDQMRSIDRDQSVTQKANDFFRVVIERYPDSPFAPLAEQKSRVCREAMAAHELYIANFSDSYGAFSAAKARLRKLIEEYPETDATVGALNLLQVILEDEGNKELADLAAKAVAARTVATPEAERLASTDPKNLPPPSLDPLLLLVTELKKQENEERQKALNDFNTRLAGQQGGKGKSPVDEIAPTKELEKILREKEGEEE